MLHVNNILDLVLKYHFHTFITSNILLRLKSRSTREASHHAAFMSSCPTISHTFLPSAWVLLQGNENLGLIQDYISLYLCLVWIRGNRRKVEFKIPLCNTVAEIFSLDRVALKILSNINDRVPLWKQPTALRCWLFPQKGSTTDLQLDCKCGSDWRCCECGMWVDCQYMEFIASTWCSTK